MLPFIWWEAIHIFDYLVYTKVKLTHLKVFEVVIYEVTNVMQFMVHHSSKS
jgi:hypothetical protein